MNKYTHILAHKNSRLHNICLKSQQINLLNSVLKEYLDGPINEHFRVANIRENCLVLEFADASWATQARFLIPEMLEIVKSQFHDIKTIECYIHPNNVVGENAL